MHGPAGVQAACKTSVCIYLYGCLSAFEHVPCKEHEGYAIGHVPCNRAYPMRSSMSHARHMRAMQDSRETRVVCCSDERVGLMHVFRKDIDSL